MASIAGLLPASSMASVLAPEDRRRPRTSLWFLARAAIRQVALSLLALAASTSAPRSRRTFTTFAAATGWGGTVGTY